MSIARDQKRMIVADTLLRRAAACVPLELPAALPLHQPGAMDLDRAREVNLQNLTFLETAAAETSLRGGFWRDLMRVCETLDCPERIAQLRVQYERALQRVGSGPDLLEVTEEATDLLAAWREGLALDDAVVAWADSLIEQMRSDTLPEWLLDLSMYGPAKCMARPSSEFLPVPIPAYARRFAIRAALLDLTQEVQIQAFVKWASGACMGEDLERPEVRFGYHLDHLWGDCARMDLAVDLVRAQLPTVQANLVPISIRLLRTLGHVTGRAG